MGYSVSDIDMVRTELRRCGIPNPSMNQLIAVIHLSEAAAKQ